MKIIFRRFSVSGGELLELQLLDTHLLDTFGSKSIARHEIDKLLESSLSWLNWIRAVDKKKCHLLDSVEQMTLSRATYKLKKSIFPIEMVNNFICRTCS
jgi:hypothetical protein